MEIIQILKEKKHRFIVILVFIIVFLFILTSNSKKESPPVYVQPTPVPTLIPIITEIPAQGDPDFYESVRPDILKNYPLFDFIPYKTDNYKIDYLKPLILEIILKKDTPAIRQEVLDWIKSKGVDPNSHTIQWVLP